jgi:endonuclease YncB( thermonuclease family)
MALPSLRLAAFCFFCLVAITRGNDPWVTLNNCQYLPNRANDGDSFHVRANGKEYIFRLYYVDAPETDKSIPKRVAEQAAYFRVNRSQTIRIGLEAERFTREQLSRPFVVRTCFQDARGRSRLPRYFAFVQIDHTDLGESLVANGLARVYGAASVAPQMNAPKWNGINSKIEQAPKHSDLAAGA